MHRLMQRTEAATGKGAMDVAIYDLDKTLVRRATFTPFLAFAARRLSLVRLCLLPLWLLLMLGYRAGLYDRTRLKTLGMRLMLGKVDRSRLAQLGRAFADRHIDRAGWNEPVIRLLDHDREAGVRIVMATAAFDFYAEAFANTLAIGEVVATRWDGSRIPGGNCYGAAKRARVEEALGDNLAVLSLRFVSDSFADAPLLEVASDPVFVTASPRKASEARRRGWRVVNPERNRLPASEN